MDSVCVGMGSIPSIDPSVDSSAEYLWTDAYGPLGQCGAWIYAHLLPQSTSSVTETPPFSASARAAGTIRCSPVRFGINKSTVGGRKQVRDKARRTALSRVEDESKRLLCAVRQRNRVRGDLPFAQKSGPDIGWRGIAIEAAVRLGSQKSLRRPSLQVFNPPSACVIV
jgi:hypothetical protein